MNIEQIIESTPGISIIAGNLHTGALAVNAVSFTDAAIWTDQDKKDAFLASIKDALHTDTSLFDLASLKTYTGGQDITLHELRNVEIFRVGTWNGEKFTDSDLNDIVAAFPKQGYRVPIKLGHKESSGDKAFGWVSSIRKQGDKLVADLADLPVKVYEAIKARAYDAVSSEIFSNLRRGDAVFKRALKAVALLGSEIPAVAGLKPLRHSFTFPVVSEYEKQFTFNLSSEEIRMDATELKAKLDAALQEVAALKASGADKEQLTILQAQVKASNEQLAKFAEEKRISTIKATVDRCKIPAYRELLTPIIDIANGGKTESHFSIGADSLTIGQVAERLIDKINADAEILFRNVSGSRVAAMSTGATGTKSASEELAERIDTFMQANKTSDYAAAMNSVLNADPDLAARYNSN